MTSSQPKRVVVTGCSSGIGLATAHHLAAKGHRVVGTVRGRAHGTSGQRHHAPVDGSFELVEIDVRDRLSVAQGVAQAVELLGGLDGLVNNAGISQLCAVEDLAEDDLLTLLDTNCVGALRMCQAVVPVLRDGGGGTIVNVSSMNAQAPFPFTGGYAASKAALEALCEALALEVARFAIRVCVVQPGVFNTAIGDKSLPRHPSVYYAGEVEAVEASRAQVAAQAPPTTEVAMAIEQLLCAEDPEVRVRVGRDAKGIARRRQSMTDAEFRRWVWGVSSPTDM